MSYQAVRWALYEAPVLLTEKEKPDSTARQVLVVLAEHADDLGRDAYPAPLRIAYATGLDVRTVERAMRRLEHAGLMERTGIHKTGTVKWALAMSKTRSEADWGQMQAEAEATRERESKERAVRRAKAAVADVSGTQDAGLTTAEEPGEGDVSRSVRHGESRRPARRIPASGTERPPNHPLTTLEPPTGGFPHPPDPPRPKVPPSSGPWNETPRSLYGPEDQPLDAIGDSRPRPRARADPTTDVAAPDEIAIEEAA